MKTLPTSPTPEACLAVRMVGGADDPALLATRAVAMVRIVARLHAKARSNIEGKRRESLYALRWAQADTILRPFGLAVIVLPHGVGIGTYEASYSPAPAWLWEVEP